MICTGGKIYTDEAIQVSRVVCPDGRGLAMSRSVGDTHFDWYGVTAEPDIKTFDITSADRRVTGSRRLGAAGADEAVVKAATDSRVCA